jgi:hypothetical protein
VRDAPPTRYPAGKRRPRTLRIDQARTGPRGAQSWLPRVAMRSAGTARSVAQVLRWGSTGYPGAYPA